MPTWREDIVTIVQPIDTIDGCQFGQTVVGCHRMTALSKSLHKLEVEDYASLFNMILLAWKSF